MPWRHWIPPKASGPVRIVRRPILIGSACARAIEKPRACAAVPAAAAAKVLTAVLRVILIAISSRRTASVVTLRSTGDRQRITWISCQTFGLGKTQLFLHDVRPQDHRDHFVKRVAPAHPFASHPTVRRDDEPFGRDIPQSLTDQRGDLFGALDLERVVIDDADRDLLLFDDFADRLEIAGPGRRGFERQDVGIDLIEGLEGRPVALYFRK